MLQNVNVPEPTVETLEPENSDICFSQSSEGMSRKTSHLITPRMKFNYQPYP